MFNNNNMHEKFSPFRNKPIITFFFQAVFSITLLEDY